MEILLVHPPKCEFGLRLLTLTMSFFLSVENNVDVFKIIFRNKVFLESW